MKLILPFLLPSIVTAQVAIEVTINRGEDIGQSFGSLFEVESSDGSMVIGAGFQNAYNTRYRADRHEIQFFVRPKNDPPKLKVEKLPRPSDDLTGAYLFSRDGVVYSTYGGMKRWDADANSWQAAPAPDGGTHETMRVGNGLLEFGSSSVKHNGEVILPPPEVGSYQLFYYANGHLFFYHVNRGDGPYRPWTNDEDGFSKLYACPWRPGDGAVDLGRAFVHRTPVVGETTFAWGQLRDQIVTGSNIGGFYVFEDGEWRMILDPPLKKSFQLYSSVMVRDRLLMGQYPTGRLFAYDGESLTELPDSPPVMEGVRGSSREAQTTVIYGGQLFVGVWPWGELWRQNPDSGEWAFERRMFDHPAVSGEITHPYDVENHDHSPRNFWGQRVTSLVPNGPHLFVGTSSKSPSRWYAETFPFLAPDLWKSYGSVYRLTMPGHLSASAKWTDGPTTLKFVIDGDKLSIKQDGEELASAPLEAEVAGLQDSIEWGAGIFGDFSGSEISGTVFVR